MERLRTWWKHLLAKGSRPQRNRGGRSIADRFATEPSFPMGGSDDLSSPVSSFMESDQPRRLLLVVPPDDPSLS